MYNTMAQKRTQKKRKIPMQNQKIYKIAKKLSDELSWLQKGTEKQKINKAKKLQRDMISLEKESQMKNNKRKKRTKKRKKRRSESIF
tara:strand:- start:237 stop:497 length:261 start_codon:yes stop_codon:yes gene_type:complete